MKYKGYTAQIEIDEAASILFGTVLDIKDVITFKGNTIAELEQEFHNSVDDYLEWCAELGEEPDKPFSGKLPFRTTAERHRQIYLAAKEANKSINAWMDDALSTALNWFISSSYIVILAAKAIADGTIQKIMAFIAPKIIGGTDAPSPVGDLNLNLMTDALELKEVSSKAIDSDILIEGYL